MQVYHSRVKTKLGGRGSKRKKFADKIKSHVGGHFVETTIGPENKTKLKRMLGGKLKISLAQAGFANVVTKEGTKKVKIKGVLETPSNRHYARKGVITKGTIVETEIGKAKITSRPAQHGVLNAVLIEESK